MFHPSKYTQAPPNWTILYLPKLLTM